MHRNLLLNLLGAVYWFDDAMQENMEAQGFSRTSRAISFMLLNIAQGEHRAVNIARNLGISRQAVGSMLMELRNRGMVVIRQDPDDGRSQIVDFSPQFAAQGAACVEILQKLEAEISRRVGAANFRGMSRALAADWGVPPRLEQLSRKELVHGKMVWQQQKDPGARAPRKRRRTARRVASANRQDT